MKNILSILLFIGFPLFTTTAVSAQSLSPETLQKVQRTVIALCRGGTLEGSTTEIEVVGEGDVTIVLLKRLLELGVNGRARFSQSEWEGIKAAIPEKWDQSAYNDCVNPNIRLFVDKLEKSNRASTGKVKLYEGKSSPVCDDRSYVTINIYRKSARRPKQEVQLVGNDIDAGSVKLTVGESTITSSNCKITLADTGFDRDFYARLKYRLKAE